MLVVGCEQYSRTRNFWFRKDAVVGRVLDEIYRDWDLNKRAEVGLYLLHRFVVVVVVVCFVLLFAVVGRVLDEVYRDWDLNKRAEVGLSLPHFLLLLFLLLLLLLLIAIGI